jgi:pimeloyl-ACP methyl ester carboxylesterase
MIVGTRNRVVLIAALIAIAIGMMAFTRLAMNDSPPQERERTFRAINNVILVHGAWADGSSWAKVIPMLSARGMHVVAVQNHLRSFAEDVDTTRRAIAAQNGPVLLVGHAYGGAVITQAGDDPKVAGLVYVAGFAPEVGESPFELLQAYPSPIDHELQSDHAGFIRLSPEAVHADLAQDLSEAEQALSAATQGPRRGRVAARGRRAGVRAVRRGRTTRCAAIDARIEDSRAENPQEPFPDATGEEFVTPTPLPIVGRGPRPIRRWRRSLGRHPVLPRR